MQHHARCIARLSRPSYRAHAIRKHSVLSCQNGLRTRRSLGIIICPKLLNNSNSNYLVRSLLGSPPIPSASPCKLVLRLLRSSEFSAFCMSWLHPLNVIVYGRSYGSCLHKRACKFRLGTSWCSPRGLEHTRRLTCFSPVSSSMALVLQVEACCYLYHPGRDAYL